MRQKTRRTFQNLGVIALILLGLGWVAVKFMGFTSSTYTDNAQVRQQIIPVNSRVQGFVKAVNFNDYTPVHKGDTLVVIEDTEFRLRLAQAHADLQNATSGRGAMSAAITTTRNNLTVNDAALAEVKALMDNAQRDLARYKELLAQEAVTQQQYDAVETNYAALKAKYDMLSHQKRSTDLTSQEQTQRLGQNDAGIELAKAAVELAELNLSYTVIISPCDGYASKKNIQVGQLVQPGQTLLTVVDTADTWVVANYKETQTARMAVGDSVRMTVDAIPGVKFMGYIEQISQATGAQYSVVPQDNATGNFVKVEQRVPVKIRFAANTPRADMARLRTGLNVECKVID
ncbi:MAG: HlyD family secretion protein [Bacteroidales bacterium]|nr:HlyD family secretion protein [Bacteroidales bacterium]